MNILIVCSGNRGRLNPFISEQVDSLAQLGINADYFIIQGKGLQGYLSNFWKLKKRLKQKSYSLIHAHYGLSGLFAAMQRRIPVITTFHGSDVNHRKVLPLSKIAARGSAHNIVVKESFTALLKVQKKTTVIPCGIDFKVFHPIDRAEARAKLGFEMSEPLVLFTSSFNNSVKNYPLAKAAIAQSKTRPKLIELKNYSRAEVSLLMNAADILLMTSFSEGSPQVVKEAIACRLPVVSTDVGDVAALSKLTDGITIIPFNPVRIAEVLDDHLRRPGRVQLTDFLSEYDSQAIALRVKKIYADIIK